MKNIYKLVFSLSVIYSAQAQTTYYVAANGNDTNSGTSSSAPFKTIDKVNTLTLQAGSQVLFRRGDTFRGMLTINQSGIANNPIIISAYGVGNKPTLAGSTQITNWTYVADGKWQATCNSCGPTVTGIFDGGVAQPLGRYPNDNEPNRGYLTVSSHTTNTAIVSKETIPYNFVGAEIVVRSNYFIIDRVKLTQQNSNTLTVSKSPLSDFEFSDNFGYFFQNHPNTVDRAGEWYYNPTNKQVTLYDNFNDPNNRLITASTYSQCITARGRSGININNINFIEANQHNVYIENCSDITLRNIDVDDAGENGIYCSGSGNNLLVENCTISNSSNNGFQADTYNGFTFRNNLIRKTGLVPGKGLSGNNTYNAFTSYAKTNTLIELNRIDSAGYGGINFPNQNAIIQRNVVSNFLLTKNDGGGYYMTNNDKGTTGNVSLINNIVFNGFGVPDGTPDGFLGANGIYIDNCVSGITIRNNTAFNCSVGGIYLHDVTNILSEGNICYNNNYTQFALDQTTDCPTNNNTTRNNVFVSTDRIQFTGLYITNVPTVNVGNFGTFSNNVYSRPVDDVQSLRTAYPPNNSQNYDFQSLKEWQTRYNRDTDSRTSPITYKDYILNGFTGPERVVGGDFTYNSGYGYGGPFIFSDNNNGVGAWDNNNRLGTGGSLNLNFTSVTGNPGASLYAAQEINSVSKDKDYIIRFNAVSPVPNRLVQVYIQYQNPPFLALVDSRPAVVVGTTPNQYEIRIKPIRDLDKALAVLRVFENAQPLYIDNFSFREADITRINKEKLVTIKYNPTGVDSTITVNGKYKTVDNQQVDNQITLPAYSSAVLFREKDQTETLADFSLKLEASQIIADVNQAITFKVRLSNTQTLGNANKTISARWVIKLPSNFQITNSSGLQLQNNTLRGVVFNLPNNSDTTFTFQARLTTNGTYKLYASIEYSNVLDIDAISGQSSFKGEDDEAIIYIRTKDVNNSIYASASFNVDTPVMAEHDYEFYDATKADLNLHLVTSQRLLAVGQTVSFTLTVENEGGSYANNVQIQHVIPNNMEYVTGGGRGVSGVTNTVNGTIARIAPGSSYSVFYTLRATAVGQSVHNAEIISSDKSDPDSTPNNRNNRTGEDDQAQVTIQIN